MRMPSSGVTLIELLIALSILAITLAIAVPSFTGLIRETRLTTAVNSLHGALFYTRSEAIKRGRRVTICTSINGQTCVRNAGWQGGWAIFEDANGNGVLDATEAILRVSDSLVTGVAITGDGAVRDYVTYIPSGLARGAGGALPLGKITACSDGKARAIIISASGRPRTAPGSC